MNRQSFRTKILVYSVVLSLLSFTLIAFNTRYFQKKDELLSVGQSVKNIETILLKCINAQHQFFTYDQTNPQFFKSGSSQNLLSHKKLSHDLSKELELLKILAQKNNFHIGEDLSSLQSQIIGMRSQFQEVTQAFLNRGYMDFGYEGKMRQHIHNLEDINALNKALLLSIRRHEKDYIIRQDEKYIEKLNTASEAYRVSILTAPISESEKSAALIELNRYHFYFNKLIESNRLLGNRNKGGIRSQLSLTNSRLLQHIHLIKNEISTEGNALFIRFRNSYATVFAVVLLLQIGLSIWLANRLTKPLKHLTNYIENYVSNGFKKTEALNLKSRKDEFGKLGANFNLLEKELHGYIGHFKEMVAQRTK